jgi:hypothetical protein
MSLLLSIFLLALNGKAHPTSFEGSTGVMGHFSNELSEFQLNYSFKHWFAVESTVLSIPEMPENQALILSANILAYRWNTDQLQGNLYGSLGVGSSDLSGDRQNIGNAMLQFDIEDRKYYFLTKHQQVFGQEGVDLRLSLARLGFAPYVGKFDEIHTWLIMEWSKMAMRESGFQEDLTPFLRVFYKNILFEIGQSFKGNSNFNFITHF